MRLSRHVLVIAASLLTACDDSNTLTAPPPTSSPAATPTPAPPLDLNGEWSGTFAGGLCATPEQIHIRLSHVEDRFRGFFEMSCLATFTRAVELDGALTGTPNGYPPHVWLNVNDQHACLLSGVAVTSTRIEAWSRSSNLCVGAKLQLSR